MVTDIWLVWLPAVIAFLATGAVLIIYSYGARRNARRATQVRRLVRRFRDEQRQRVMDKERRRTEWDSFIGQIRRLSVPSMVVAPDGTIIATNPPLQDLYGYGSEEELLSVNVSALYADPLERQKIILPGIESTGGVRNAQVKGRRRDGSTIETLVTIRGVVDASGKQFFEGIVTDITELKREADRRRELEAQLHLSQKLEAVGQLASGIAHEINTPIQFVGDNLHFLRTACDKLQARVSVQTDDPLLRSDINNAFAESLEGIGRVTEIVRAMKEFAHPGDAEVADVDINQALATTLIVSRNEYRSVALVETHYGEIPPVKGRRGEINKMLLNLIVNAAHALESKVKGNGERGKIVIHTEHKGWEVFIRIADTGCGIAPAAMKRIFDPFFTTKTVGKGTGQGLAIAQAVVIKHGGRIEVSSRLNEGTMFTITLPATAAAHAEGMALVLAKLPGDGVMAEGAF